MESITHPESQKPPGLRASDGGPQTLRQKLILTPGAIPLKSDLNILLRELMTESVSK